MQRATAVSDRGYKILDEMTLSFGPRSELMRIKQALVVRLLFRQQFPKRFRICHWRFASEIFADVSG